MATKKKKTSAKKSAGREKEMTRARAQWVPFIVAIAALLVMLCLLIPDKLGVVGLCVSSFMFGTLGFLSALILPVLLCVCIFRGCKHWGAAISCAVWISATVSSISSQSVDMAHFAGSIAALWTDGIAHVGGGVLGGLIGGGLRALMDWGAIIVSIVALVVSILIYFDITPYTVWMWAKYNMHKRREALEAAARRQEEKQQRFRYEVSRPAKTEHTRQRSADKLLAENEHIVSGLGRHKKIKNENKIDVIPDDQLGKHTKSEPEQEEYVQVTIPEEVAAPVQVQTPAPAPEPEERGEIDLDRIFDEVKEQSEAELSAPTQGTTTQPALTFQPVGEHKDEPAARPYTLPPIFLLKENAGGDSRSADETARQNAVKLVKTLASFKVNTHVSNITRGPRITRYELVPEDGVRVRSVANLVDDISLSLATEGVRIEAPIPGKSAIGIEVPNKDSDTVGLRELIANDEFKNNKSKLYTALGVDVVGAPRYCDIAKMPHLLIAGTTGSGKSVCINSIICSLLYRATPDEVKLILIDPKKVEFAVYNGLPHLLVPVVSNPKKAAGTLNWACIEMERRFDLIEDVGVRDIKGYNEVTKDDPDREFLPQIVIVIDELADLMMTAKDDVETSICRIAQKARACGMHLIIGTQRPSVDVITGLIKANVPSRIAFTVTQQVDSRIIIDMAGAEKLVGRGDMLYSPVGSTKPARVQGAFVSDEEVNSVVEFIKTQSGDVMYDEGVVESIDKEAERCGSSKKAAAAGAGDDSGDEDPKLMEALEVAVDAGKISTSLLQRRLSVGYGKAAKLIDQLEAHGWVGPLDGSKPREVRISKEQYTELVLSKRDSEGQ